MGPIVLVVVAFLLWELVSADWLDFERDMRWQWKRFKAGPDDPIAKVEDPPHWFV
jgi:hypothetical protein